MLLLAVASLVFRQTSLQVSRNQSDITPPKALPLGGYTERGAKVAEPGGDPLYARAVVFQSGSTKIAMASVDTLTIPESLAREVQNRLHKGVFLFLAATHTHSAPDSQMLNDRMTFSIPGIASYKRDWLRWYADQIGNCINHSMSHPSQLSALRIKEGQADANVGRRKFADPDKTVTLLYGNTGLGADQLLMLQYAAHGTVYGAKRMQTSGDWPEFAATKFGAEVLQGAIGDVLPKQEGATPEESMEKIAQTLAHASLDQMPTTVWTPNAPVATVSEPITLDPIKPHPTMAKTYGVPEAFADSIVKQFAPPKANITAFRLGKLAVVGVPGEPTSILGKQIRDAGRRMGFTSVLVCSHVNGWMGYILDPEDYDRGGYEATLSFYGREEGAKVVQAGIEALKKLAG
jgi:neutral ceramidase